MGSVAQMLWGTLFGAIGFGYFLYGKKQSKPVFLIAGIALCVFPYFISDVYALVLIGIALLALPYFIRR